MKKILLLLLVAPILANAQFKGLIDKANEKISTVKGVPTGSTDIAAGLKEA
jgi:hypothetical protein